jgi:serine/threonine-protein kinase
MRRALHVQGAETRRSPASHRADRAEPGRAGAEGTRSGRTRAEQTRSRAEETRADRPRTAQRRGDHRSDPRDDSRGGHRAAAARTPAHGNGTTDRTRAAVRARGDDRRGTRAVPLPDRTRRARGQQAEGPRRTSTTTGVRLGPLGRLSWPLVALLALLAVLLVASLVRGLLGSGGGPSAAALPAAALLVRPRAGRATAARPTAAALPVAAAPSRRAAALGRPAPVLVLPAAPLGAAPDAAPASDRTGFGMMNSHESRAGRATPTSKDV